MDNQVDFDDKEVDLGEHHVVADNQLGSDDKEVVGAGRHVDKALCH